jgi:hypothetical protein
LNEKEEENDNKQKLLNADIDALKYGMKLQMKKIMSDLEEKPSSPSFQPKPRVKYSRKSIFLQQ